MKMKIEKARELSVTLIKECDPSSLADFLTQYLDDTGISFEYGSDDFLKVYVNGEPDQEFLKMLLED